MEDENKVYKPQEIQDTPFPTQDGVSYSPTQTTANQTYSSSTVPEQPFPKKIIARETISTSLNTLSRKITKAYEFIQQGAIQIGKYIEGVSGDIRLSPDGITARNSAGETTFSLDGDTGDATFKGQVRAGSIVSDTVITNGNNFSVDEDGNVIANAIQLASSTSGTTSNGLNQTFTSSTEGDITGMSISITITVKTLVYIAFNGNGYVENAATGDFGGNGVVRLKQGATEYARAILGGGKVGSDSTGNVNITSFGGHKLVTLDPGLYTISLTGACDQVTGSTQLVVYSAKLSLFTLGAIFS